MKIHVMIFAALLSLGSIAGEGAADKGPLLKGGTWAALGFVSDLPAVAVGFAPVDHLFIGLGAGVMYKTAGAAAAPFVGVPGAATDKWGANILLDVEYMIHDVFPFAMGPAVYFHADLAPTAFENIVIRPGWSFWYAPFSAPVAIGAVLALRIDWQTKVSQATVALQTPALRFAYIF